MIRSEWQKNTALSLGVAVLAVGLLVLIKQNFRLIDSHKQQINALSGVKRYTGQELVRNLSLLKASANGDVFKVRELLDQGADINFADEQGWTPLIQAAVMNRFNVVKILILRGANVNARAEDGSNALQHAVIYDHLAMVRLLVGQGADPKLKGRYGWNAIETAQRRDRKRLLAYLRSDADSISSDDLDTDSDPAL